MPTKKLDDKESDKFVKELDDKELSDKELHDKYSNFKHFDLRDVKLPFGARDILRTIPQRWPLLLVDRVDYIDMKKVLAVKASTIGEHTMMGHFPGYPVTPGVVMIEACAQVCTLLAYFRHHHPINKEEVEVGVRMVTLDCVRLRKEVLPGDMLSIEARHINTKNTDKKVFHRFEVVGKVGDKVAVQAKMTGYFFNDIENRI